MRATTPPRAPEPESQATGEVVPLVIPAEAWGRITAVAKRLGVSSLAAFGMALKEFCEKHEGEP